MHAWARYYKSTERRGREMDMYPPGRIIFVRPLKTLVGRRGHGRRLEKGWDTVWVTPQELIAEGILISGKVGLCIRASLSAIWRPYKQSGFLIIWLH